MILVEFEKDIERNIIRVKSWRFISKEASLKIVNIPGYKMKFEVKDIPANFYKFPREFFLDSIKLRRFYDKKSK